MQQGPNSEYIVYWSERKRKGATTLNMEHVR